MATGWPKKAGMRVCLFVAGHCDLTGKISGDRGSFLFTKSALYQFSHPNSIHNIFSNLNFTAMFMEGGAVSDNSG
jgi:hypothetical protein